MSAPRAPRLLVSAGPTREYLDDIRYLTNASSGRMGIEVAAAAARRGWPVHLLLGPSDARVPAGVRCTRFTSACELDQLARAAWPETDAFVATAAVSDFRPAVRAPGKIKKAAQPLRLALLANPDVLLERSREKGGRVLVGFALEADSGRDEARRKLVQKSLDLIILNGAANLAADRGEFEWIEPNGAVQSFHSTQKSDLAEAIIRFVETTYLSRAEALPRHG